MKWIQKSKQLNPRDNFKKSGSAANFLLQLRDDQLKQCKELFDMCDQDKDGVITKTELHKLVASLGLQTTGAEFDALFTSLDYNGDGRIQFEEFISGMRWLQKGIEMTKDAPLGTEKGQTNTDEDALNTLKEKKQNFDQLPKRNGNQRNG